MKFFHWIKRLLAIARIEREWQRAHATAYTTTLLRKKRAEIARFTDTTPRA